MDWIKKIAAQWKDLLVIILGNAILALGVRSFIVPHNFISGGATGIAIFLQRLIPLPLSGIVAVLNVGFFILGAVCMGHKFALTTLLSTILYPSFLRLFESIEVLGNLTDDLFLCSVLGGLLLGAGVGLTLRSGSSTGGTDVLPLLGKKYWNISVAKGMVVSDLVILAFQALFSQPEPILYGAVSVVLSSIAIDKVMVAGESEIQMMVISEKHDKIRDDLLTDLGLGVTMLAIETGYQGYRGAAILSIMPSRKYPQAKQITLAADPTAFIIVSNVSEVNGRGYTIPDLPEPPPRMLNSQPQ